MKLATILLSVALSISFSAFSDDGLLYERPDGFCTRVWHALSGKANALSNDPINTPKAWEGETGLLGLSSERDLANYLYQRVRAAEMDALLSYKSSSKDVNRELWKATPENPAPAKITELETLAKEGIARQRPTPEVIETYYGYRIREQTPKKEGDVYEAEGFTSTSFDRDAAKGFAGRDKAGDRLLVRVLIPKGANVVLFESLKKFGPEKAARIIYGIEEVNGGEESELLIASGARFRMQKRETVTERRPDGQESSLELQTWILENDGFKDLDVSSAIPYLEK